MREDDAPDRKPEEPPAPAPEPPRLGRRARREKAAADAMRSLIRDLILDEFGHVRDEAPPLELTLKLRADPADNWALAFSPDIREQVLDQSAEYLSEREAFHAGRIYCYRCGTSFCPHAMPPGPLTVFRGYDATGIPTWHEFTQSLLDASDPRVDQLFETPPKLVARWETGKQLKEQQLNSYGRQSRTYAVLGQVVAGYFRLRPEQRKRSPHVDRLAVTWQVVESRDARGQFLLRLNPVAGVPGGGSLEELFAAEWEPWLSPHQARAARAIAKLEASVREAREAGDNRAIRRTMGRIPEIMKSLAISIERGHRQSRRRTRHAEQRRGERRPVQMALRDLARLPAESLLFDERSDTIVAPAEHGRTHVFTRDARHVTSFVCAPAALSQRIRRRRWVPLSDAQRDLFMQNSERLRARHHA